MLLSSSNENFVIAHSKYFFGNYVKKNYIISTLNSSTSTRLKLVNKLLNLRIVRGIRKKCCKLRQHNSCANGVKVKSNNNNNNIKNSRNRSRSSSGIQMVTCFQAINKDKQRLACWKQILNSNRSTKAQRTIDYIRSNNGSYLLRKSKYMEQQQQQQQQKHNREQQLQNQQEEKHEDREYHEKHEGQQHKKRYEKQQQQHYQFHYQKQQQQQQQQQKQKQQPKHLQIVRLYARSGAQLRRRRKKRFFINLYSLPFNKLKAIKTTLTHNTTWLSSPSSLLFSSSSTALSSSSSSSSSSLSSIIMLKDDGKTTTTIKRKCTNAKTISTSCSSNMQNNRSHNNNKNNYNKSKEQHECPNVAGYLEKAQSKEGHQSCSTQFMWRDILACYLTCLTSLLALTSSSSSSTKTTTTTTTRLNRASIVNFKGKASLPRLFQRYLLLQYFYSSCWNIINLLNKYSWIFLLIYSQLSANVCLAGYHEKRLLHDLLDPYNTLERPVLNESDPLQLSFGLTLMQIIDVDEKNQLLVTNVWLKLEWNDMNLRWNTSDYGGVKDLRIPPHRIWKPDVLMYNSADEGFDGTYQTNVVVRNNGSCLYVPPGIFKSTCKIDITWFPFDDQRCEMKFGSWTYDGFQLDLQLQDETGGDISSYVLNGEWELLGVPGKRNEIYYNCCPEPYIDITFAIIIRRRTLYYFFNLIIPCVLIASMALLGFTLPPDSGEKLSLGVTILLSLTVFLNMVAETMPATSDAVPLLGTYFNCIMFMVASSVVSTILILNYHHRNADTHEMSEWIRVLFLCWLPWILRMSRPGRPLILEFPTTPCSDTSSERKHQILSDVELKERSSKSLLANVLDIDDDFRAQCRPMTPGGTLPHNPAFYRTVYGQGDDGSIGPIGSTRMPDAVTHHTCIKSSTEYELSLILKEIRFITDQLRKEDEENDIANDWKFAAMVVDRLCLIIFTMFTILATIAVLLSAPHIIVS